MPETPTSQGTVNARPLSYAEIDALAHGQAPLTFDCYKREATGTLTPATCTVEESRGRKYRDTVGVPHRPFYASMLDPRNPGRFVADPDDLVGFMVRAEITTIFEGVQGLTLFTSPDAEESAAQVNGFSDPETSRLTVYVADSHAEPQPLTPIYGSQVSVSVCVADIDPETLAARVEEVLRTEFGDSMSKNIKVLTRAVEDRRVAVYDGVDGTPLALGILAAEVPYVKRAKNGGAVRVEAMPEGLVLGG